MTDRKNIHNSPTMEKPLAVMASSSKSRVSMNLFSMAVSNKLQEQQAFSGDSLADMIKHPPMPDGTGQIINIGA